MKKLFLVIIAMSLFTSVFGQSFFKTGVNYSNINYLTINATSFRPAFYVGHQFRCFEKGDFQLFLGEGLDLKRFFFQYYKGGHGGGTTYKGNTNHYNIEIDLRLRLGRKLFYEIGSFTSYSFFKTFHNQSALFSQACLLPTSGGTCPFTQVSSSLFKDEFKSFDYGILLGIGYHVKQISIILDYQHGFQTILNAAFNSSYKTNQLNMTTTIPVSFLKRRNTEGG